MDGRRGSRRSPEGQAGLSRGRKQSKNGSSRVGGHAGRVGRTGGERGGAGEQSERLVRAGWRTWERVGGWARERAGGRRARAMR